MSIEQATCGYCKDCRWWGTPSEGLVGDWASCQKIDSRRVEAGLLTVLVGRRVSLEPSPVWLETAPNFGCVQFEAKAVYPTLGTGTLVVGETTRGDVEIVSRDGR